MKLPYKVMSSAALSVVVASIPVIVHAQAGDFYNQTKQLKYSQSDLRSNATLANKLQDEMDNGDTIIKEVTTGQYLDYVKANDAFINVIGNGGDANTALTEAITAGATSVTSDELDAYTPATGTLDVSSVSAINNKTFVVNFSGAVDKTTAENATNYTLVDKDGSGVTVHRTILNSDGQSVTIVAGASDSDVPMSATASDYKVTVKSVKSADLKTAIDATNGLSKTFTVPTDLSVPQVSNVEMVGTKMLNVTFSEPVVLQSTESHNYDFQISSDNGSTWTNLTDDGSGAQVAITQSSDLIKFSITFNTALATGDYKIKLVQDGSNFIQDFAGYNVPQTTKDFTVSAATTVGQVTDATINSRTEVVVTFDKPVVTPSISTLYWNTSGEEGASSNTATQVTKVNDTTFKYTFSGTKVLPTGDVYLFVKGVTDAYGNPVPTKKLQKTVASDAASTATITVKNDDKIEVVFSKDMVNDATTSSVTNRDNYVLKNSKGETVSMNATGVVYTTADSVYKATLNYTDLPAGNYTLSISGIKDQVGTAMTAIDSQSITVADTTGPASFVAYTNGTNKITLTFPEAMKTTGDNSIGNLDNYQIQINGAAYADLPTGTTVAISSDAKSVTFTLPTGTTVDGVGSDDIIKTSIIDGTKLYVVADAAGNAYTGSPVTINTESGSAPALSGTAKIASATTLEVPYTGAVIADSTLAANDFLLSVDSGTTKFNATSVQNVISATGNKLLFTIPSDYAFSAGTDVSKVKVYTQASGDIDTKTALGTKFTADTAGSTVSTVSTSFAASLKAVQIIDSTHLRLTLDGLAGTVGSATGLDNIIEVLQDGKVVAKGYHATPNAGYLRVAKTTDSDLVVTLGTAIDTAKDVVIRTVGQDYIIATDKNSKPYVANTTGLTATAQGSLLATSTAATIASEEAVADGDTIDITFNRLIDPASIKTDWTGSADTAATVNINAAGELSVVGYNFGKITGFDVDSAKSLINQKIEIDNSTGVSVLRITFANAAATLTDLDIVANGDIKYVPSSNVKSPSGMSIDTTATPFDTKDAAPVLLSARLTETGTGTNQFGDEVGDTITLTYSEDVAKTVTAGALGSTPKEITAAEVKGLDSAFSSLAATTPSYTATLVGNTITITVVSTGTGITAIDNTTPITVKGTASAVTDLTGNDETARNTGVTMSND